MRHSILRRSSFLLGFSSALGVLLAVSVTALAGSEGSASSRAEAPARASDLFAAFDRARTADDALSPGAAKILGAISPSAPSSALDPGRIVASESRRVVGPNDQVTFLAPTEKQQVCFAVPESNESGCTDGSTLAADGVDLRLSDADGLGQGEPTVLSGFIADDVISVQVSSGGDRLTEAATANGVFYATTLSIPNAVVVTFQDGSERRIVIPAPPEQ